MKLSRILGWSSALCLSAIFAGAQETNETAILRKQLKEVTEKFEKALQEQRQMIELLSNKLEAVHPTVPPTNRIETVKPSVTETPPRPSQELAAGAERREPSVPAAQSWSPSQPMTLVRAGSAYINVSFGALVDAGLSTHREVSKQLHLRDPDPL